MNSIRTRLALSVGAAMVIATAVALPAFGTSRSHALTVQLKAVNGSGQSGIATLTPTSSSFTVVVKMKGRRIQAGEYDHIHNVTCKRYAQIAPNPRNPTTEQTNKQLATATIWLTNIYGGKSKTTVTRSLRSVTNGDHSINVHTAGAPYMAVACGDIPKR